VSNLFSGSHRTPRWRETDSNVRFLGEFRRDLGSPWHRGSGLRGRSPQPWVEFARDSPLVEEARFDRDHGPNPVLLRHRMCLTGATQMISSRCRRNQRSDGKRWPPRRLMTT